MLSLRFPWAGLLLRLINAARLFPAGTQQGTAKTPCCGLCNSAVTSPTFTHQEFRPPRQSVSCYWYTVVICYGGGKFIRNRGWQAAYNRTHDNQSFARVHTNYADEKLPWMNFTLFSIYTIDLLCSDHFQWLVHGKFSMTTSLGLGY